MDKAKIIAIAAVVYAANAAYSRSIGDNSFCSEFSDAPEWQKQTNIKGVEFRLANPDAKPSASHESWLKEKAENGWVYGEVKDPDKKTHPCILPYDQLPPEQRKKDDLFLAIVDALK